MRRKPKARLLQFGLGGHSIYYPSHKSGPLSYGPSTLSGYDRPDNWKADDTDNMPEGCPVVDVREACETAAGYSWVFKGPMVNVDLEPATVEACPVPSELFAGAVADNSYGALLALQAVSPADEAGPLDSVDVATYLQGWREHGARTGVIRGGQIVWDA